MSVPEHISEAKRWLRFAREDLLAAEAMLEGSGFEARHACWLAQQSAEKALKAAFVLIQVDFPWSHDLDALRNLLPGDWRVTTDQPDLAVLTEWATEARYPDDWPEVSNEDAVLAVRQAREIWKSIYADFADRGVSLKKVDQGML